MTKVKTPKQKTPTQENNWEIKDRSYYLNGPHTPLTLTIPGKHSRKHPLLWYDPETKEQREIRYATNQNSPFRDNQKGEATLGHIIFKDGSEVMRYEPGISMKFDEQEVFDKIKKEIR